jgi:hypothetical protein
MLGKTDLSFVSGVGIIQMEERTKRRKVLSIRLGVLEKQEISIYSLWEKMKVKLKKHRWRCQLTTNLLFR